MSNNATDQSSEMVRAIRDELGKVMKRADEFVTLVEGQVKARENELDQKIRKYNVLKEKEKKLKRFEEQLKEREKLVKKEKQSLRDKRLSLDKLEDKLNQKLQKVKSILD